MTDSIEDLTRALLADLAAVHARILDEITDLATRWYGYPPPMRLFRLRQLERELYALADEADSIAARQILQAIHTAYGVGAWSTALTLTVGAEFSGVDVDAVTHLAQDTMDDLLRATQGMREDVKAIVRDLARDETRAKLYTGQTAVQAGRDLAAALRERGVTAVVYADGRHVSLPTYAEMVVRTKTAEAYQEGGLNQGERLGVDWWEILDGPECGWTSHDDPRKATGMIVPLAEARAYPIAHPNCRRVATPRPDLASADGSPTAPTPLDKVAAIRAAADAAQQAAQRAVVASATPVRASTGLDLTAGVAVSAAARRHVSIARTA